MPQIVGDCWFYLEENVARYRTVRGQKTWYNERAIQIFRNPVEAEGRARLGQHESIELVKGTTHKASRWFWKANRYSTNNPAHAKGMPKWTAEDDMIHWMSDEEGRPYVEVPPDPATLAQALSRIRPAQPTG